MTRRRRPRALREEERALWENVAARTQPLKGRAAEKLVEDTASHVDAPARIPPEPATRPQPIAPFELGSQSRGRGTGASIAYAPGPSGDSQLHMDRKAFLRMKSGKLIPEARLDLHGMTLAQAHPTLIRFISDASADGLRLVLVITGKGKDRDGGGPIPTRRGVLRHQVPDWLRMPPIGALVLQVSPANRKHGGEGAWYVYLRRRR